MVVAELGIIGRCSFLAHRTNDHAILLRVSSVTLCIVAKRCVLEHKLLLAACVI